MSVVLYHHPYSRAATVVWMLEEVGVPYTLEYVDLMAGAQKSDSHRALNPMGKVPVLVDGEAVVSETAAIGVYLADRYSLGNLAPNLDDPARGTWLRWAFYAPSVLEPGCMAHASKWEFRPGQAGWGSYESMLETVALGLSAGPWLLGERFSAADVVIGYDVRMANAMGMLADYPALQAYLARLAARPAFQRVFGG